MNTKCGFVAIIGRPNVGKSTLLNKIIGEKISITSRKQQTTRHAVLGIKTILDTQIIYVDTPGLYGNLKVATEGSALQRHMRKAAYQAMKDVDVVIFMVEGLIFGEAEERILQRLQQLSCPIILVINKIDKVIPKENLLPHLENLKKKMKFAALVPLSARRGTNVDALEKEISALLPENSFFYLPEQVTDKNEIFRAAEIIREKLIKALGQELPYATAVTIERFAIEEKVLRISATIFVERQGQKLIIIGKHGERLKKIGTWARQELENIFGQKVFLELWVKVKEKWREDEIALKNLGYGA